MEAVGDGEVEVRGEPRALHENGFGFGSGVGREFQFQTCMSGWFHCFGDFVPGGRKKMINTTRRSIVLVVSSVSFVSVFA